MVTVTCYIDDCREVATYFVHSYPDDVRLCGRHSSLHPVEIGETLCVAGCDICADYCRCANAACADCGDACTWCGGDGIGDGCHDPIQCCGQDFCHPCSGTGRRDQQRVF